MSEIVLNQKDGYSFNVVKNENHNRIEIFIRGPVPSIEEVGDQMTAIYHLSSEYDTCLIFLNTPGGSIATLVEFLNVINKFKKVITIASGEVYSAGFIIWVVGDIRVTQKYTSFMCHRESYGYGGKTDQQLDMANHSNKIYSTMYKDVLSEILTEEEVEKTKYTEIYFTDEDMIERGIAVSWERFIQIDNDEGYEIESLLTVDGKSYKIIDEETLLWLDEETNEAYVMDYNEVLYNVSNPKKIPVQIVEED